MLPAILLFWTATCLHAHSLHQSTAEAEYNPVTKKLEVSLIVFINDLETALVRQSELEMRLDKTPAAELDAQILNYLTKTFVVTDAAGKTAKIEWVGRQIDEETKKSGDPTVTLFFEIALPGGLADAKMRHAVFCELFKDQVNLLQLRSDSHNVELRFTTEEASKKLACRDRRVFRPQFRLEFGRIQRQTAIGRTRMPRRLAKRYIANSTKTSFGIGQIPSGSIHLTYPRKIQTTCIPSLIR